MMRITAIHTRTVRWPIAPRGAARGGWRERAALVLAVRDDLGATGLGEAAPLPGMSIDALADAAPAIEALAARLPLAIDSPGHATAIADRVTTAPAARFAIETALLSALAQRARTSVAHLLCAIPQAELAHAVVVDDAAGARAAVAAGARRIKIKATADELARVHQVARAAPGIALRVDANRSWPRAEVPRLLSTLAALPIEFVEEPCQGTHELLDAPLACQLALDESLVELDRTSLVRALASPGLAAIVLKPTLLGGFARCLELAAAAHQHGVAPVVSHALEGPIGAAACVELARAIGADVPVGLAPHPALAGFAEAA
jgi:o-succinylbenzoate synthase